MLQLAIFHITISRLYNQFNHVFALLISMPHFKSINFYQNRPKIRIFLRKSTKFSSAGGSTPRFSCPPAARSFSSRPLSTVLPSFHIFGYVSESNVFALLISTPPQFSLIPHFLSIKFYQNKRRIKLFLEKKIFFRVLA